MNYIIKYIYRTQDPKGKKRNRFGSTNIDMEATPEQLCKSKKLHEFLGRHSKKPMGHKVLSVQITDITKIPLS